MGTGDESDGCDGHAGDRSNTAETTEPPLRSDLRAPSRPGLCDACCLPPANQRVPLVRCAKCHAGWYHDRPCQQRHHRLHKKTCRKRHPSAVRVVARPPLGNALVRSSLQESATTTATQVLGVFRPVVPPVLTSSCRATHCAWCLNELPDSAANADDRTTGRQKRLLWCVPNLIEAWACGAECESATAIAGAAGGPSSLAAALLLCEWDAIVTLHSNRHDPPMYLPTALLLFRLLVATCLRSGPTKEGGEKGDRVDWDAHVLVMAERQPVGAATGSSKARDGCEDDDEGRGDDEEEGAHEDAVVRTVQAMCHALLLRQSSLPSSQSHAALDTTTLASRQSPSVLRRLLSRIKANAFGIRLRDDESASDDQRSSQEIGIGIFHVAHFANHSCRPNAEAVYVLERGTLPRLSLQTLPTIPDRHAPATHDEVTVSYVSDAILALPRSERRRHIFQQFGFRCDCTKCRSGS